MNECVKHSDAIWRGVNHTHALAHEIRRAAKHKKSRRKRARARETPSAFAVMLEVIIFLATLRLCAAPFNIGADTMEDALEMPAASRDHSYGVCGDCSGAGKEEIVEYKRINASSSPIEAFQTHC